MNSQRVAILINSKNHQIANNKITKKLNSEFKIRKIVEIKISSTSFFFIKNNIIFVNTLMYVFCFTKTAIYFPPFKFSNSQTASCFIRQFYLFVIYFGTEFNFVYKLIYNSRKKWIIRMHGVFNASKSSSSAVATTYEINNKKNYYNLMKI